MNVLDRSGMRTTALALTGLAVMLLSPPPGAGAQTDRPVVREVEIVEPQGYRRVVVRGSHDEPIVVRTLRIRRARLGVALVDITPELRRHFGVPDEETGVLVSRVLDGSPAEAAGIRVGDVLVSVDGEPVSLTYHLVAEIGGREAGETVVLEGWREGRPVRFTAELEEASRSQVDVTPFLGPGLYREGFAGSHQIAPEDLEEVLSLDPSALIEALHNLGRELDSDRLEHHLHRFQESRGGLLERIEELEKRLHELETELDDLPTQED